MQELDWVSLCDKASAESNSASQNLLPKGTGIQWNDGKMPTKNKVGSIEFCIT